MAQTRLITDLWSRTIEAQLDLARMAARSRQLGLAIVGAALIVAAVLAGTGSRAELAFGTTTIAIHASALVLGAAALLLVLLRVLDLDVYERMQRGAGIVAEALEKREPELLEGMSRKVQFASDDRARRTYTYVTCVPALAALLVLVASNARGSAVPADTIPSAPEATYAAPSTTPEPAVTDPALAPATTEPTTTATAVPMQNRTPAAKPPLGKKGAPAAAAPVAAGGDAVEDDGIAEFEAAVAKSAASKAGVAKSEAAKSEAAKSEAAKSEAAKSEAAKSEAAKSEAKAEEPKADPPPAPKAEEPKADPPAKAEEAKPADPAPPPP